MVSIRSLLEKVEKGMKLEVCDAQCYGLEKTS
jgi:hypothetical protein